MDVIEIAPTPVGPSSGGAETAFERCEQCGEPVERTQRYCVACGTHRRHVHDPAMRHLAAATGPSRAVRGRPSSARSRRTGGLGTAVVLAVIPLAVGVGVLLGRASTNGDGRLIAQLRAQKPEIITTGGGSGSPSGSGTAASASASTTSQAVASLRSDFPLQHGYAIELQALPAHGTDQARATGAEHAAQARGARSVGLIAQRDFRIIPAPPAGAYVLYSGAFKTRSAADQALAKLAKKFPAARVIQVQPVGAGATTGAGKVLATSVYGTAHQIAGSKPTASQLAAGAQAVKRIQKQSGKGYINSQRGLPDQIAVP